MEQNSDAASKGTLTFRGDDAIHRAKLYVLWCVMGGILLFVVCFLLLTEGIAFPDRLLLAPGFLVVGGVICWAFTREYTAKWIVQLTKDGISLSEKGEESRFLPWSEIKAVRKGEKQQYYANEQRINMLNDRDVISSELRVLIDFHLSQSWQLPEPYVYSLERYWRKLKPKIVVFGFLMLAFLGLGAWFLTWILPWWVVLLSFVSLAAVMVRDILRMPDRFRGTWTLSGDGIVYRRQNGETTEIPWRDVLLVGLKGRGKGSGIEIVSSHSTITIPQPAGYYLEMEEVNAKLRQVLGDHFNLWPPVPERNHPVNHYLFAWFSKALYTPILWAAVILCVFPAILSVELIGIWGYRTLYFIHFIPAFMMMLTTVRAWMDDFSIHFTSVMPGIWRERKRKNG